MFVCVCVLAVCVCVCRVGGTVLAADGTFPKVQRDRKSENPCLGAALTGDTFFSRAFSATLAFIFRPPRLAVSPPSAPYGKKWMPSCRQYSSMPFSHDPSTVSGSGLDAALS